ncbi:S8 family serine peptidase [Jiangella mangrovi]|uniref:Subtilisin family serine protease n=1 Tax=Jiangella mangrovi TaxID=1524084 RepID=A0A7W9GTW0_9ACTN|nr:S8 family serine peptidase [Jiangella mangrovi]MBB5789962.1 subtilisin family serine protease [Jiangella mangrovi]
MMIARRLRAGSGAALAVALAAAGLTPLVAGTAPQAGAAPEAGQDARVIVLMAGPDGDPVAPAELATANARTERAAVAAQRTMLAAAAGQGIDAQVEHEFTDLVHAVALTVDAEDVDALRELPGVADVLPDQRIRTATDVSVPHIGAPEVWERQAPGGGAADGTGTIVAVVDTGIDYTNPSLGGGFGEGHKVVAGHDFVNGDADPMDDNGHGTHVAGIVAGTGAGTPETTGVAPGALLTAYKVLDGWGAGYESDIIAGLQAAVDPANPYRADVVNLSLGGPGDGTDPIGLAATAATEAGVVVVAAAGNSGPGEQTMGSPALADGVLSVGASASGLVLPSARLTAPRDEPIDTFRAPFSAPAPTTPVVGELVDVGDGYEEDYDRVGDVTGKVVAYRQNLPRNLADVAPFLVEQARLAEERGALALIAYTGGGGGPVLAADGVAPGADTPQQEPGVVDVPLSGVLEEPGESFRLDRLVVMGLFEMQWEQLSRDLAAGPVHIEISGQDVTDQMASFSSRGPAPDFDLEPDIVAPGIEIRSTWPLEFWAPGVYRISGTSMAAPHVAGAAALLRQLRPDESVADVNGRLTGSAVAVEGTGPTTSGAGRVDIPAAVDSPLIAAPTSVSLGLADLSGATVGGSGTTTLRNPGDAEVAVTLAVEQAPTTIGTATVTPTHGTIPAGGELEVTVTVAADTPDGDADLTGWVVATTSGDGGSPATVRVPYLLAARHLVVQTSPDPSDGTSEAFIWSPAPLAEPPTVTVTPPRGRPVTVQAEHDYDSWYRAELTGSRAGAYAVGVTAGTTLGAIITGSASFEVTAPSGNSGNPAAWQPIGPNTSSGPITVSGADPDTAAVTQYGKPGPWTTDDGGETWRQHNRLPVAAGSGNDNLVIAADDPDTMWYAVNAATGLSFGVRLDNTYEGRILRSEDGGATWQQLDVPDAHTIALLSDPQTQVLVAVRPDAILVSHDGGDGWASYPNPAGSDLTGAAVSGDDLYLAGFDAVWAVRGILAGEPTGSDTVYKTEDGFVEGLAATADGETVAALVDDVVIGSHDGGATWAELYPVPDGGALDLVVSDDLMMVTTYRDVQHVSRDGGTTWEQLPEPINGAVEDDVQPWAGGLLWSSPGAGLFLTGDDGDDPRRIGVQGSTVHDLEIADDTDGTPRLLAGTDTDIYATDLPTRPKLPAGGAEWGLSGYEAYVGTRIGQLAVDPQDPQTVWKIRKDALSQFWVYRSTDGGHEWDLRGRTNEVPLDLVVGTADSDTVAVSFWSLGGTGLYVTRNGGTVWRKYFHDQLFWSVATDPAHPERLWLAADDGLYRSDDFGVTAEKVVDGRYTSVSVDGDRVVAAGPAIRVSDDGGTTWHDADTGGLPMLVGDLAVSPTDPDTWYAATGSFSANGLIKGGRGVLRSTDGGRTWANVSGGLQNLSVVSLEISPDGRWLYAGTQLGGVHRVRTR